MIQLSTDPELAQLLIQDNNIRNQSIEILTFIIKSNYRKNENKANINSLRDEVLIATLKAYSPEIAAHH